MQFKLKKKIGQTEFEITETAEDAKDFFKRVSFFNTLPSVGPNGEDDLVITYRATKEGHEYFSIVSQKAKQEFKLGQSKDNITLYAKGWEPLFEGNSDTQTAAPVAATVVAPVVAPVAAQVAEVAPVTAPVTSAPVQPTTNAYSDVLSKYNLG